MKDLIKRKKKYIEFDVTGSVSFDPHISASGGRIARFEFGDGAISDTTSTPIHVYADTSIYRVKVWLRDLSKIGLVNMRSDGITGVLDLSKTSLFTQFDVILNPLLTQIINPISSGIFTQYYAAICDLTGTLDLSGLTGLGGDINLRTNPNLTGIINPISTQTFIKYLAYDCDLGYIDFTPLSNMSNINNAALLIQNNGMTAAEVNHILVDLDTISIDGGYTGRVITIDGTNAAPDGTSGGFDGLTAKANLITKNFTVTTN